MSRRWKKNGRPSKPKSGSRRFNVYTTDVVSIHEAYPGHYAQFLCLNASAPAGSRKFSAATLSWKVGRITPSG